MVLPKQLSAPDDHCGNTSLCVYPLLNRRKFEFNDLDMGCKEFREVIVTTFPKLSSVGGFQLCRCKPNSRELEPLSRHVMTSPRLLKERVGQGRTYIVPLQVDLDLTPTMEATDEV